LLNQARAADYMDLFKPGAPWASTAAGLKVFQISTQLALRGTDGQLNTVQVAPKIAILQRYFPNIQIGEVDGVNSRYPMLARDILEYTNQLHKKLRLNVAFVHADIARDSNWRPQFQELVSGLRTQGTSTNLLKQVQTASP